MANYHKNTSAYNKNSSKKYQDPSSLKNNQGCKASTTQTKKPYGKAKQQKSKFKIPSAVHFALAIAGFIPVIGTVVDLAHGALYMAEGNTVDGAITLAAAIPGAGDALKVGRMAYKGGKALVKAASSAGRAVKNGVKLTARGGSKDVAKALKSNITVVKGTGKAAVKKAKTQVKTGARNTKPKPPKTKNKGSGGKKSDKGDSDKGGDDSGGSNTISSDQILKQGRTYDADSKNIEIDKDGYTKSSAQEGTKIHTKYRKGQQDAEKRKFKEPRLDSGARPDFVDYDNHII
jgi:hypothetical protein